MLIFRVTRRSCPSHEWHAVPALFSSKEKALNFVTSQQYYRYRIERMCVDVFPADWDVIIKKGDY